MVAPSYAMREKHSPPSPNVTHHGCGTLLVTIAIIADEIFSVFLEIVAMGLGADKGAAAVVFFCFEWGRFHSVDREQVSHARIANVPLLS